MRGLHATPSVGSWLLERGAGDRFPYRLRIFKGDTLYLSLWVQDRWPAAGRNIFCLRDEPLDEREPLEEIERAPIVALQRRGPRLSVVLARLRYKRCDFLFLSRAYKGRPTERYEQIFWMTQQSMMARRPRARSVSVRVRHDFTVRLASDERYPWRFPNCSTERGPLPVGDYALVNGESILAVVERKTLENLLADFGVMAVLHQRLLELSTHDHHALVVEAPYEDFLNSRKIHHYSMAFCAAAIGELYAAHPRLRIVFCANRKMANEWTRNYFAAVWKTTASGASSLSS